MNTGLVQYDMITMMNTRYQQKCSKGNEGSSHALTALE